MYFKQESTMKFKALVAAAALATVSTAAVADDVVTPTGELVIVEKEATPALGLLFPIVTAAVLAAVAAGGGSTD